MEKEHRDAMKTTGRLLAAVKDIWAGYNSQPFVLGIQEGSLPVEKFRYYIIQDYLYLQDYARTFALGAAKAKSLETARLFTGYLQALTGEEMDIHRGYMGRLGLSPEELEQTPRGLASLSYTSYMLRIAYEEGETEILAAVLSCALSYEFIAKKMLEDQPLAAEQPFYGDWVRGYVSESYGEENRRLSQALDSLSRDYTQAQLQHLTEIFINCSEYERAFWDMSWNLGKCPLTGL